MTADPTLDVGHILMGVALSLIALTFLTAWLSTKYEDWIDARNQDATTRLANLQANLHGGDTHDYTDWATQEINNTREG